jgi:hypothetical protein
MREATRKEHRTFLQRVANGEGLKADLGAAYERDSAEHTRALSAWEARHEAAKEESGYNRADTLGDLANSRLSAAKEAMANTRGITIEGLRCKARASAKIEEWASTDPHLAISTVEDLTGKIA